MPCDYHNVKGTIQLSNVKVTYNYCVFCVYVCVPYSTYVPSPLVGVALHSGEVLHGDGKEHITFIPSQHYSRENSIVHFIYCRDRFSCVYVDHKLSTHIYMHHNLI